MKTIKTLIFMCFVSSVFAQDINPSEVTVIEGFNPQIPEFEKVKEVTKFLDTTKINKTQEYTFLDKTLNINYETRPLNSAKVSGEKVDDLYRSTILVGGGTHFTSVSNITFNSIRENDYSYGLTFNHFANTYSDENSEKLKNSLNQIHLFGKKIFDRNIFVVNLDYDRRLVKHKYRLLPESITNTEKNRFSYSKIGGIVFSRQLSKDQLKHRTHFFVSDLNELSENQIHFNTDLTKHINGYPVQLEVVLDNYINYSNTDDIVQTDVKILGLNSFVSFKKYDIDINLGFSFDGILDSIEGNIAYLFPYVALSKHLVRDILYVEGGIEANGYRNTIKSLSDDNPYIYALGTKQDVVLNNFNTLDLRTTEEKGGYLYMRNVIGDNEIFEGKLSYAYIENKTVFYKVLYSNEKYLSSYLDVWRLHANANYDWQINDLVGIHASANYFYYDTIVSYNENFNANLGIDLNLDEKIKISAFVLYLGERKSVRGMDDGTGFMINYGDILKLDPQIHANISIDYNYTKSISGYLKINNILNSKKDIWEGYQEIGRNAWLGLSYSF